MQLILTSTSKNYKDLKQFLSFLQENPLFQQNSFALVQKQVKKKVIVWTLLKSPHINNTAKEQYEVRAYSLRYSIQTENLNRFALLYKKAFAKMFFNVSTEISTYTHTSVTSREPKERRNAIAPCAITKVQHSFPLKKYDVFGETCFNRKR